MKKPLLLFLLLIAQLAFAQDECIKTFTDHSGPVKSVAFSPDGNMAISGSSDNSLKIWDMSTRKCIKTLTGHTKVVRSVAFIANGKKAISASDDRTLKLWDVTTGQCLKTFTGHDEYIYSMAVNPAGTKVLSGCYDHTIKLWDIATGQCLKTFNGHSSWVESLAFSPDGKTALSASFDGIIIRWDIATGQKLKVWDTHNSNSIAISADGKTFLSGGYKQSLMLWNFASGECIKTFPGHNKDINAVAFSPDGQKALSGSSDKDVRLWDLTTGYCLKTFSGHNEFVTSVAFSPDGKTALSCSQDKTIKLWDLVNYKVSGNKIELVSSSAQTTSTNNPVKTTIASNTEKPVENITTTTDTKVNPIPVSSSVDVDINIPFTTTTNDKTFVVIIANENYSEEVKVDFAINDGTIFKEYCEKTLGIPADNIHFAKNATYGKLITEKDWLSNNLKAYKGDAKAIFYYAGHGIPGGQDQPAYLLPADGTSSNVSSALKLDDLYLTLTENPNKGVTVFLDACFSGSTRDAGMLSSARGTKLKPREITLPGNLVVFSAASGDETAWPYKDKQHGMFTYYLLKKLQETKGDVGYKELADYINDNVYKTAIKLNSKPQTPTTKAGSDAAGWQEWKLK
jgi:WD40 repeat protein